MFSEESMATLARRRKRALSLPHEKDVAFDDVVPFGLHDTGRRAVRYRVAAVPDSCRAALLLSGPENPWPSPVEATSAQDATSVEARKKEWVERYLSVCYPLRHIRVTSPYGYRSDPFTGKRRFHDGLDLHARGEAALAMMKGVVVRVGQDRSSGKYVTLRHGSYTVSYCHLSKILVVKGMSVRPRDAVGVTGSTGRSTGEHLHITCRLDGRSVDPSLLFDYIDSTRRECVQALAAM